MNIWYRLLFIISFTLISNAIWAQSPKNVICRDNYSVFARENWSRLKTSLYKPIFEGSIKGYKDKGFKQPYSVADIKSLTYSCETISVQLDPNDPYNTRDSIICSAFDSFAIGKISINYTNTDNKFTPGGFVTGLGFDSFGTCNILIYMNLEEACRAMETVKCDLLRDFYAFSKQDLKPGSAAVMDSQSFVSYADGKYQQTATLIFKAAEDRQVDLYSDENLTKLCTPEAFEDKYDIQKNADPLLTVNGIHIVQDKSSPGKTLAIGLTGPLTNEKEHIEKSGMFYIKIEDVEKLLKVQDNSVIGDLQFLFLVAGIK